LDISRINLGTLVTTRSCISKRIVILLNYEINIAIEKVVKLKVVFTKKAYKDLFNRFLC